MPSALSSGLRCRCPACGEGALFEGFLTVRSRCPECGVDLSAQDSGDGPVAFIILIVGGLVVALALLTEVRYGPPVWVHLLLWLPLTLILVLDPDAAVQGDLGCAAVQASPPRFRRACLKHHHMAPPPIVP